MFMLLLLVSFLSLVFKKVNYICTGTLFCPDIVISVSASRKGICRCFLCVGVVYTGVEEKSNSCISNKSSALMCDAHFKQMVTALAILALFKGSGTK